MKNLIILILVSTIFSAYSVGDIVSDSHQNQEFDLCYSAPGTMDNTIRLADFNGNTNGGDYHVLVIDMSATWCGPCVSLIPLFDDLHQVYNNNQYVELFVALTDLNQPYSCTQWGNMGDSGIPNIINDTGYPLFNMFNTGSSFPSLVMIDHEMRVHHKEAGYYPTFVSDASELIDEMLFNMENSLILYTNHYFEVNNSLDDGDGILNPGESFSIDFVINNNSFYLDAYEVTASANSGNGITFDNNTLTFGDINVDGEGVATLTGSVNDNAVIGNQEFVLMITSTYIDLNGNAFEYEKEHVFNIDISLNQLGFPFDTNSEVRSNPVVVDFTGDGNNEIIFGDNVGLVHVLDYNGNPILNSIFPYDTGNQIWGSPAAADIDGDELVDIVITSKSKHLYVFDLNGLKLDFNANQYLIGTPALGNLDDDSDLEIVFGSYSNDAQVFAINLDGTNVDGFPLLLDEKMQKGVALADFDNNGKDDIVVGTDDDNIYLIYDDGSIGFSYQTGDKVRSAPIVIEYNEEKYIIAGSKDATLYAINSSGEMHFSYGTDGSIYTSPSVLETENGIMIFVGDDEGFIHSVDMHGNMHDGFPFYSINGDLLLPVSGSIIFEDLDSDGLPEMIYGDEGANLHALKADDSSYSNFSYYNNMPISNTFAYSSSVSVQDMDNDGDLEIIAGTVGDVLVYDIKADGVSGDYWNIYRNNNLRNGYYVSESSCLSGDINNDAIINILDIVNLLNIIIDELDLSEQEQCSADVNSDGIINILDIVLLVNTIIEE